MSCIAFLLSTGTMVSAQDADPPMSRAGNADRTTVVLAPNPEQAQLMLRWAEKAKLRMETVFGETVPFQQNVPLVISFDANVDGTVLLQSFDGSWFRQKIVSGVDLEVAKFAVSDALASAYLNRMILKNQAADTRGTPREAPHWLAAGFTYLMLPAFRVEFSAEALRAWEYGEMDYPEAWTSNRLTAANETDRALLMMVVRFLFEQPNGKEVREKMWAQLAAGKELTAAWWVDTLGAKDLREIHIRWDVWMSSQRLRLLSQAAQKSAILRLIGDSLVVRLGEYGIAGSEDVPRYEYIPLSRLQEYVTEPWVPGMLQMWMVRLQTLGFRQSEDVQQILEACSRYAMAVDAAHRRKQGRKSNLRSADWWWEEMQRRLKNSVELEIVRQAREQDAAIFENRDSWQGADADPASERGVTAPSGSFSGPRLAPAQDPQTEAPPVDTEGPTMERVPSTLP